MRPSSLAVTLPRITNIQAMTTTAASERVAIAQQSLQLLFILILRGELLQLLINWPKYRHHYALRLSVIDTIY